MGKYHWSQEPGPKKRKPIPKKSERRIDQEKIYLAERKLHLLINPTCQAQRPGCTTKGTDVHHMKGRTGSLYTNREYFLTLCRNCHTWVENNPHLARIEGFTLPRIS